MKTPPPTHHRARGNVLIVTIIITAVMGLVLVSYLSMVSSQGRQTARSQTWNSCLVLAEAGVEEALSHLNKNGLAGGVMASQGWTLNGTVYYCKRPMEDGYYEVTIQMGAHPIVISKGCLPAPLTTSSAGGAFLAATPTPAPKTYITRTIQVDCRAAGHFAKAIVAKDTVDLNGKYVVVDSYHAYDTNASLPTGSNAWGIYDASKRRDHGDVAVIAGFHDDLNIKAAKVWGRASTGPDGDLKMDNKATVGSSSWHAAGKTGVQPGWSANDANFDMPPVVKPFTTGYSPTNGTIGGVFYNAIYGDGDYKVSQLKDKILIAGKARILVTDKIEFKDGAAEDDGIVFQPDARLEIYMDGTETKLVGVKTKKKALSLKTAFNEDGNATNFLYFGTDRNTKVELAKMDEFTGIIYAPKAEVKLKAGSVKYYRCHLNGSIQGFRVKLEKNANVHYDENIGTMEPDSYVVESWKEI
jgi:hypothetical protein